LFRTWLVSEENKSDKIGIFFASSTVVSPRDSVKTKLGFLKVALIGKCFIEYFNSIVQIQRKNPDGTVKSGTLFSQKQLFYCAGSVHLTNTLTKNVYKKLVVK
jgi:hypothetical protein